MTSGPEAPGASGMSFVGLLIWSTNGVVPVVAPIAQKDKMKAAPKRTFDMKRGEHDHCHWRRPVPSLQFVTFLLTERPRERSRGMMRNIWLDIIYAARVLRRAPG